MVYGELGDLADGRLEKLGAGEADGLILAVAGLERPGGPPTRGRRS
nr:hypothetical protein [Streptomyces sp. MBT33]